MSYERTFDDGYSISCDKAKLDRTVIHNFLAGCYWAMNIPRRLVDKSIEHSLCFGVYHRARQVGFARVISDYATFAYLADVFIIETERGKGLSQRLMEAIMSHPELQGLRRWQLVTRDAHSLYQQFGFETLKTPERHMEIAVPNAYLHLS